MTSLAVSDMAVLTALLPSGDDTPLSDVRLTQGEAARLLGTTPHNVNALVAARLLPRTIRAADIMEFTASFALTTDLLDLLRERNVVVSSKHLSQALRQAGVEPHVRLKHGDKLVWCVGERAAFIDRATCLLSG
ncbi:hypothetical protein KEU06_23450 [Pseudaminobacter sp. 19-2017]|uniref:Uncharacterized protein n=1 Tax=Pseudaminobacter soli (ex Zhang et al. 2022) TaxID=2831468 RepID=A0A942E5M5_9HYPH|nr:hypothetical protein [Pseudaminobacter soli]MBS3651578.1 hypothetical protein [Pseudaminobacter soli]